MTDVAGGPDGGAGAAPVSGNLYWTASPVGEDARRALLGHAGATVWLTGLSGSGKTTIAHATEAALISRGVLASVLDGDNVRHGLNRDLGFAPHDRAENIRRVGEVCRLMADAGVVVVASFISPYAADRDQVRDAHDGVGYLEVFVDTPLAVCEQRDVKGLYAKARSGDIPEFSGVSAPYEVPAEPDLRIDTTVTDVDAAVAQIIDALAAIGVIGAIGG